jgi:hypothetical protein
MAVVDPDVCDVVAMDLLAIARCAAFYHPNDRILSKFPVSIARKSILDQCSSEELLFRLPGMGSTGSIGAVHRSVDIDLGGNLAVSVC